jgi:predicted HTH domain antitoxin
MMKEITLQISEEAFAALRRSPDEFAREMRLAAAIHWYEHGEISQEKAAEIAGLDRTDFLLELARQRENVFVVEMSDLAKELERG